MRVYFQIGTNDGHDLFNKNVLADVPDMVVLVEPNQALVPSIESAYEGVKNVKIFNNAISYRDGEEVDLVIPASNGEYGTRSANGLTYQHWHFSMLPMNDWGEAEDMHRITAKTITFDTICESLGITEIDFLQLDTEGFDTEILLMLDLSKYKVNRIRFEKWTFPASAFTRYNSEIADRLGNNGLDQVIYKLKRHGYEVKEVRDSDGDDFVATRS
jgi:FkbM family methyltransferase